MKRAATFNFFFTNIGLNIANIISTRKKSPMTCLKNKILISYYFYPTTPDKVIKIIKCFYDNKSSSPESLLTQLLKNCADALSSLKSRLVNVSFTTGEVPKLCKIANIIWLIALIVHLYSYSTHLLKYLKNVFKSFLHNSWEK